MANPEYTQTRTNELLEQLIAAPGGGGAGTVANGADVNAGATTDAAVTADANGTMSAKLRGIVKILADVWNSGAHVIHVAVDNSVAVTGAFFQAIQPVSGTFWQATQPVSLTTLPALVAGSAKVGQVAVDHTTPGTTDRVRADGRFISALITTLTRPANVTAYAVNDSISDNATIGSVTALVATVSDINDDPVYITEIIADTNDTGLAAGALIRGYLYNSNPTAGSGVKAGDNAAFSNNKAGFVGSFTGSFRAFADGGKARLLPEDGYPVIANPSSGGLNLWVQYQTLSIFTPSANSTTIDGRIKGVQGRA